MTMALNFLADLIIIIIFTIYIAHINMLKYDQMHIIIFIISMTKLLDADWLRGVQVFHLTVQQYNRQYN